jgi:prepilin-type processing-associated H-X9-DG protein
MHSVWADGHGGFMSPPVLVSMGDSMSSTDTALRFYPGAAFVGFPHLQLGNFPPGSRYRWYDTDIDWSRHRRRGDGGTRQTEARGRANFGFADGHVASYTADELGNRATRRSRLVALWSPLDYALERLPMPQF